MTASGSATATSEFGDDGPLEGVDCTIHRSHPVGHIEDVTQIPRLGVQAPPYLGGFNVAVWLTDDPALCCPPTHREGPTTYGLSGLRVFCESMR